MAKGCDHDSVNALETYLKAVPWKIESEYCMVMGLQM